MYNQISPKFHFKICTKICKAYFVSGVVCSTQNFGVEKFNFRNLSEMEVRNQYQIKISKRFAALENLNDSKNINRA